MRYHSHNCIHYETGHCILVIIDQSDASSAALKTEAQEEEVTEDEIRLLVDLGEEKGILDESEKQVDSKCIQTR